MSIANDDTYPTLRKYSSEIIIENVSKLAAEYMEQEAVNVYYSTHGEAPEGNKKPLPDPLRGRIRKKFDKIDQKLNPSQISKIKEFLRKIKN